MSDTHAQTVSYVRKTMLAEQAPPVTQAGPVKWLRENMFSSWLNIILTLISLYVIYVVLSMVLPWAFGGVWYAGSLTECREVLFSFYQGSHGGACWAVIEDRFLQLMFGFYPPELYWRPIVAFLLLFVALAPVLFADKVPGQMMWFTVSYPFLATWLIWGGSFWMPIFVALGFVVAGLAAKIVGQFSGPIVANLSAVVAAALWWGVVMTPLSDGLHKLVGSARFDATVAALEADAVDLPLVVAEFEARAEVKDAEIAAAVDVKNQIIVEMAVIRREEFAIEQQIEPKGIAFQRLDGAQESVEDLSDILADWGGAPVPASDASVSEIAEAEAAAETVDDLIDDIGSLLSNALSDLTDDTVDPADIGTQLVVGEAQKDPSITQDVAVLVSKASLTEPLAALVTRAGTLSTSTSQSDLDALRADIRTSMSAVSADLATLETILDKIIATNAPDLEEPQARFLAHMRELSALRDDAKEISQTGFRVASQDSASRNLLTSLQALGEREASLPVLREAVNMTRAALPSDLQNMIAMNQLPEDVSNADRAALGAYLDVLSTETTTMNAIRSTYAELGRVGLEPIVSRQIGGFLLALIIGVAGIVLSLPLGILLALGRQSHLLIVNKLCVVFIETIRGIPLIVWLFTASVLLNYFLPPGSNFDLMLRVIIMVTFFASAYIAEVIRGGLAALPTGQYEGADSLGLSYWQSMQLIVLPQAMKIAIPGIVNTFIGLFKDTTLVVFIGLLDPIGFANAIRADTDWNGVYWELFVFIGLLFFVFCFSMGRYSLHLERKLQREHR